MQAPLLPNDDLHQKLETPPDEQRPRRSSREPKKVKLLACTTGFNKRKRSTHFLKQSSQSTEEYPLTHNTGGEPGAGQDPEVDGESQNSRNELSYESDASGSDSSEQGLGRRRENSRKLWTQTEDNAIVDLVREFGTKRWTFIAQRLREKYRICRRTGKQCRERWHNHLDPYIKKDPISCEEEKKIFMLHKTMGNKWAEIAKKLPGRSDNCIKNYFYSTHRKHNRRIVKMLKLPQLSSLLRLHKSPNADELYRLIMHGHVSYEQIRQLDPQHFRDLEPTMCLLYDHTAIGGAAPALSKSCSAPSDNPDDDSHQNGSVGSHHLSSLSDATKTLQASAAMLSQLKVGRRRRQMKAKVLTTKQMRKREEKRALKAKVDQNTPTTKTSSDESLSLKKSEYILKLEKDQQKFDTPCRPSQLFMTPLVMQSQQKGTAFGQDRRPIEFMMKSSIPPSPLNLHPQVPRTVMDMVRTPGSMLSALQSWTPLTKRLSQVPDACNMKYDLVWGRAQPSEMESQSRHTSTLFTQHTLGSQMTPLPQQKTVTKNVGMTFEKRFEMETKRNEIIQYGHPIASPMYMPGEINSRVSPKPTVSQRCLLPLLQRQSVQAEVPIDSLMQQFAVYRQQHKASEQSPQKHNLLNKQGSPSQLSFMEKVHSPCKGETLTALQNNNAQTPQHGSVSPVKQVYTPKTCLLTPKRVQLQRPACEVQPLQLQFD